MIIRSLAILLPVVLLASCAKTTEPTPDTAVTRTCDDKDFTDVFQAKAALNATAVGDTCTKDYDCWLGQVCTMGKCAAQSTAEKLHGDLALKDAGDYVVSVFSPVDDRTEAAAGDIEVTFGEFPARDSRLLQVVRRAQPLDANELALLNARVAFESSLRTGETEALNRLGSIAFAERSNGPARAATCAANEFGFRNNCYAEGVALPDQLKFKKPDGTLVAMNVTVQKVTGKTAVLVDVAASVGPSGTADIATQFDTIAGPRVRQFFNNGGDHTGKLDTDGNGKIAIVLSPKVGAAGLAGIFQFGDVLAKTDPNATGNEMDMLWSVPVGQAFRPTGSSADVTPTTAYLLGTLAHEYQHVINFARSQDITPVKNETLFLNESLSHLAEDLSGYGASNITTIQTYLQAPESTGLLFGPNGEDKDSSAMRGLGYLYLRWAFERAGGTSARSASGPITDKGGIAMLEKFYTAKTTGVASLAAIIGSSFCRYPLFFPALAISNNAAATLVATDARFNFKKTELDVLTGQPVGISLDDSTRKDAFGTDNHLVGYVPKECDSTQKAQNGCVIFASGGVSFLWEGAPANGTVSVKGPSANNVRLSVVRVK